MKPTTFICFTSWLLIAGLNAQNPAEGADPFAEPAVGADPFADLSPAVRARNLDILKKSQQAEAAHALAAAQNLFPIGADQLLSIRHEEFSLDLATAAALQRKYLGDAALYQEMLDMVAKGTAKQESMTIVRALPGQKAVGESISELMYPTEWEPAEIPNTVGVRIEPPSPPRNPDGSQPSAPSVVPDLGELNQAPQPSQLGMLIVPATGTAFETRNTGRTLEAESTALPTGEISVRIICEHVVLAGNSKFGQGASELTMPDFETRRISTEMVLSPGRPAMAGTVNRPPNSKVDADAAGRIWFAFVTAHVVEP
jgi:hypothetical protein